MSTLYGAIGNPLDCNVKISPDGKCKVSYDKYTSTMTITNLSTNVKGYIYDGGSCDYSWTKDSKCLKINYFDGRSDVLDVKNSSVYQYPNKGNMHDKQNEHIIY